MEIILNLGLCNAKLACGLKFGQGILTTVEEQIAYFIHPPISISMGQDFNDCGRLRNLDCRFICFLYIWNNFQRIYRNLVNNDLNV